MTLRNEYIKANTKLRAGDKVVLTDCITVTVDGGHYKSCAWKEYNRGTIATVVRSRECEYGRGTTIKFEDGTEYTPYDSKFKEYTK